MSEETTAGEVEEAIASQALPSGATLEDFYAYPVLHQYIDAVTRKFWPPASITARFGPKAARQLDRTKSCRALTWCPGQPMIIKDKLVIEGGWVDSAGDMTFNLYRPPQPIDGDPDKAGRWLKHGEKIFGADYGHILKWCAWKVQRPGTKINHGLVLGSRLHGIGKDMWLKPLKRAVGEPNFKEKGARQVLAANFDPWLQTSILRINEAHDFGDKRFSFYDRSKEWMAAPPETLNIHDKNIREWTIFNLVGVIISTNHKTDGIYLPREDRRHYVAWSDAEPESEEYFRELANWYDDGGLEHAAAYLATLDLSGFDPFAPPVKTEAFWAIVNANETQEDSELADALDAMKRPEAVTVAQIKQVAARDGLELFGWLEDHRNRRAIPHRMERNGYSPVYNDADKRDGQWKIGGKRQVIYAQTRLNVRERSEAVRKLIHPEPWD
jgi:hypothetical protein